MSLLAFGNHVLHVEARQLLRDGVPVHLEPKVMDLLLYLVRHPERCVPREELRASLWPAVAVSDASLARLVKELRRALMERGDRDDGSLLRTVHGRGYQFVGRARRAAPANDVIEMHVSARLAAVLAPAWHAAAFELPVIIEGEIGTGKDSVARALHARSGRPGALAPVRCVACTEAEIDAALASVQRDGGTLLLDELSELAPVLQRHLLARLAAYDGAADPVVQRRIVTTSQRPLSALVAQQLLRGDLLARLDGIRVQLPPLRERAQDVGELAGFLLQRRGVSAPQPQLARMLEPLAGYEWPFNVRELELLVLRWFALNPAAAAPPASRTRPRDLRSSR